MGIIGKFIQSFIEEINFVIQYISKIKEFKYNNSKEKNKEYLEFRKKYIQYQIQTDQLFFQLESIHCTINDIYQKTNQNNNNL